MTAHPRGFASDNNSGAHPDVLAAIAEANDGHVPAYGDDDYTATALRRFREHFGEQAEAFLVFNGTGANVLALQALARPHEAVICPETAHLNVDECGAPERIAGVKLLPAPTTDGKLTPSSSPSASPGPATSTPSQPRVVSISESTELGTVYTRGRDRRPGRLSPTSTRSSSRRRRSPRQRRRPPRAAASRAHRRRRRRRPLLRRHQERPAARRRDRLPARPELAARLPVHPQAVDAARLEDAVPGGAVRGPARRRPVAPQRRARQRHGRAASPMRSPPSTARSSPTRSRPTASSRTCRTAAIERLRAALAAELPFYVWDEAAGTVRLMCSWDTTEEDVDGLAAAPRGGAIVRRPPG